jgi:hypothetical protein
MKKQQPVRGGIPDPFAPAVAFVIQGNAPRQDSFFIHVVQREICQGVDTEFHTALIDEEIRCMMRRHLSGILSF